MDFFRIKNTTNGWTDGDDFWATTIYVKSVRDTNNKIGNTDIEWVIGEIKST